MSAIDWILLGCVALCFAGATVFLLRRRKKSRCTGCCGTCGRSCGR